MSATIAGLSGPEGLGMRLVLLAITAIVIGGTAFAQTVDQGVEAFRKGDYAGAVAAWRPAAEAGDPDAQLKLSMAYQEGIGVEKDTARAVSWIRKSAEQGWKDAQAQLGARYLDGDGVAQDYAQALVWSQRAADQGIV